MAPIASILASALGASTLTTRGFSYHDNSVYFSNSELLGGSFTVAAYAISAGQDPQTKNHVGGVHSITAFPVGEENEVDGSLDFTAGRHATTAVSQWWSNYAPSAQNTFGHNAGALNFAFIGTLLVSLENTQGQTSSVSFNNIGFAQGSDSNGNNWWFGGQTCTYLGNNDVDCAGLDQNGRQVVVTFVRGGGDTDLNEILMGSPRYT